MKSPADNHKQIGQAGENAACAHLERLGWEILARNFRCARGEMDVIAQEPTNLGGALIFVEVKTRRGRSHGLPIEAVNAPKQRRLLAVAQTYLALRAGGGEEPACRFDIAEVWLGADGLATVRLRRGAFDSG